MSHAHPDSRMSLLCSALAICAFGGGVAQAQSASAIPGWAAVMTDGIEYRIAPEPLHRIGGNGSTGVGIESRVATPAGAALLLQSIRADEFRGRRIRFAGWLRTEDVEGQTGLLARVDGEGVVETSDYMIGHAVTGTTAWRHYEVVLDVPRDAIGITFGVQLTGTGQVFADDFSFEAVDATVAVTGRSGDVLIPAASPAADGNGDGVVQAGAPRGPHAAQLLQQEQKYAHTPLRPRNLDFEQVPEI